MISRFNAFMKWKVILIRTISYFLFILFVAYDLGFEGHLINNIFTLILMQIIKLSVTSVVELWVEELKFRYSEKVKISKKNIENWRFWKMSFFWVGHFEFFFSNFFFFASFPLKSVQIYMVEWMGRNFDVFPGFQKIPCYA